MAKHVKIVCLFYQSVIIEINRLSCKLKIFDCDFLFAAQTNINMHDTNIHSLVISAYPWGSQILGGNPSGHWENMQTPQREAFIFFLQLASHPFSSNITSFIHSSSLHLTLLWLFPQSDCSSLPFIWLLTPKRQHAWCKQTICAFFWKVCYQFLNHCHVIG